MIKTIVWGAVLATLIGVELRADAWIVVHEVNLGLCKKVGGVVQHDEEFEVEVCNIPDKYLTRLLEVQ